MRFYALLSLVALASVAPTAQSQSSDNGPYGEVGYLTLGYKDADTSTSLGAMRFFIGNNASENWTVEAMFGRGVSNGTGKLVVPYTLTVGNMVGIYAKTRTKPRPDLEVFGRLGYVRIDRSLDLLGNSFSGTGDDISYGAGLGYKVGAKAYLTADYMSYYNKDSVSFQGATLGVRFKF